MYPIRLPIRYELVSRTGVVGSGKTARISSHALVFTSDTPLEINDKLRLTLEWPAHLPDGTGLNLWIVGTVVRRDSRLVEVAIIRYEFRTRRKAHIGTSQLTSGKSAYGAGAVG
jgi:hypothetical protein